MCPRRRLHAPGSLPWAPRDSTLLASWATSSSVAQPGSLKLQMLFSGVVRTYFYILTWVPFCVIEDTFGFNITFFNVTKKEVTSEF